MLTRITYDANDREWQKFLPVPSVGLDYQLKEFYKYGDVKALSMKSYDVLNRPIWVIIESSRTKKARNMIRCLVLKCMIMEHDYITDRV